MVVNHGRGSSSAVVGVFGAHDLAQYVICDRANGSNDDHSSKSNLSQEVEAEASVPKETPAKSKGASYVVSDVSGFDDAPVERNKLKYKLLVLLDYSNSTETITTALGLVCSEQARDAFHGREPATGLRRVLRDVAVHLLHHGSDAREHCGCYEESRRPQYPG